MFVLFIDVSENSNDGLFSFIQENLILKNTHRSELPTSVKSQAFLIWIEENPKLTSKETAKQFDTTETLFINHLHELGKVSKLGQ